MDSDRDLEKELRDMATTFSEKDWNRNESVIQSDIEGDIDGASWRMKESVDDTKLNWSITKMIKKSTILSDH